MKITTTREGVYLSGATLSIEIEYPDGSHADPDEHSSGRPWPAYAYLDTEPDDPRHWSYGLVYMGAGSGVRHG